MYRSLIHILCLFSLIVSACGPAVQPTSTAVGTPTGPTSAASGTIAPTTAGGDATAAGTSSPTATSTPAAVTLPTAQAVTPTPLPAAREEPTAIPAPACLASPLTPPASGELVTSIATAAGGHMLVSTYTSTFSRTNLYISDDGGASWSSGRTFNDFISDIVPSPAFARDHIVFAVGSGGVYRSLSGGTGWTTVTPSTWFTTTPIIRQFAVSPNFGSDHTILLGSGAAPRGVFASTDGGATWIDWLVDAVDTLLFSPNYAVDRAVWLGRNDEQTFRRDVLVTVNQGDQWDFVRSGTAVPFAISPAYAQDSTILWTGINGGLYLSRNGDRIFPLVEKANADSLQIWRNNPATGWEPAGEETVRDVAFSPGFAQDRTVFGLAGRALIASRDGGFNWLPVCYWTSQVPAATAVLPVHLAISVDYTADNTLYAGGAGAQLLVSHDRGQTWTVVPLK